MIKIENDCVGCGIYCCDCGLKHSPHYYCDKCGDEETLFYFGDKELCISCIESAASVDDGDEKPCEVCGDEDGFYYDEEGGTVCIGCLEDSLVEVEGE